MRISDWSSDVCSSDLGLRIVGFLAAYRIDLGEIGVTLGLQTRSLDGGFASGILTPCGLKRSAVGRIIDLVQQRSLLHIAALGELAAPDNAVDLRTTLGRFHCRNTAWPFGAPSDGPELNNQNPP